ncbi:MAG: hypothetical protein WBL24_09485, partial [Kiritimatiellia bacterium]
MVPLRPRENGESSACLIPRFKQKQRSEDNGFRTNAGRQGRRPALPRGRGRLFRLGFQFLDAAFDALHIRFQ